MVLYIDLLDAKEEERYRRNPNNLKHEVAAATQSHIVIDEIQKAPKLLDVVHHLIETTSKRFILTGSSARKLKNTAALICWQDVHLSITCFHFVLSN